MPVTAEKPSIRAEALYRDATFRELAKAVREAEQHARIWESGNAAPQDLLGWDEEPVVAPLVLDVRDRDHFTTGHLRGAWNVPGQIEVSAQGERRTISGQVRAEPRGWHRLRFARERPVVRRWSATLSPPNERISLWVHCADGSRSRRAAAVLAAAGYRVTWVNDDLEGAVRQGVVRLTSSF